MINSNVIDKVWTESKTTWKYNMCVPYVHGQVSMDSDYKTIE